MVLTYEQRDFLRRRAEEYTPSVLEDMEYWKRYVSTAELFLSTCLVIGIKSTLDYGSLADGFQL